MNEHLGIVSVEARSPVLSVFECNSGGPTKSIVDYPPSTQTGWMRAPEAPSWADILNEIAGLIPSESPPWQIGHERQHASLDGGILWFRSCVAVALFAYFTTTIYVSCSADPLVVYRLGVAGEKGEVKS